MLNQRQGTRYVVANLIKKVNKIKKRLIFTVTKTIHSNFYIA